MASETRFRARGAPKAFPGDADELRERLKDRANPPAAAETLTYKVELITPLFGGGVMPGVNDLQLPVRMKGLRGQLRFWWRLLAAHGGLADCLAVPENSAELYAAEAARWGGADANGKPVPGRIGLHASNPRDYADPVAFENCIDERRKKYETASEFNSPGKAIEYALFPAKHGEQDGSRPKKLILPEAGFTFTLEISVHAGAAPDARQIARELRLTVDWWATFGGIGARWRRGAGSVRVRDENSQLLCVLDDNPTYATSLPNWATASGMQVKTRDDCKAMDAWAEAIKRLRLFRQDPDPGIGRGGSLERWDYGQSFWPEPHLARHHHAPGKKWGHTIDTRFVGAGDAAFVARGAFGLPLGIKFPQDNEPPDTNFVPVGSERMASPLILRAVARGNDRFTPCALLLPWWRETLGIRLKAKPSGTGAPPSGYRVWPALPADRVAAAAAIAPIDANQPAGTPDPDPLSAFMAFFPK